MNCRLKIAAAALLAVSFVASYGQSSEARTSMKKHTATGRAKAASSPTVEEQIQALRQELEGQIENLKNQLAEKDAQLKQAQQSAARAEDAATKAEAAASSEQQVVNENSTAVSTLQSNVNDLKGTQASLATTISDETAKIKKEITYPDEIHFRGITISPTGSFLAAETYWRNAATGGGLNTPFTGIPLQYSDEAQMSEFDGTGRQSRVAIKAIGKLPYMTLTGYYEMDWLGTGITSNNNQSNSYVLRMRQLWADARLNDGWDFSGGQGWSLATETTQGLRRGTEILPWTIDPQYEAGFVWTRQYSFRVTRDINNKYFLGVSAEAAETLNPAGSIVFNSGTTVLLGSAGVGGGLYNPTANYSFNLTPDFVAKLAVEPGWGHWELFGIGRSFRDRIYVTDETPNNSTSWGGGIGGGFRGPLFDKKVTIGMKGLWGTGVGRYGSSTIADVTIEPNGVIAPLHAFSALSSVELNPNKRLLIYLNYGGDYIYRDILSTTANVGYGNPLAPMGGCNTEVAATSSYSNGGTGFGNNSNPASCSGNTKDVQEATAGYWFKIYDGPMGSLRQGLQYSYIRRDIWSGANVLTSGATGANPGGSAYGDDNMVFTSFRYYLP
ncbi:MAG: hypothetical protein ACP5FH_01845 [Terracidiphilus sp.]